MSRRHARSARCAQCARALGSGASCDPEVEGSRPADAPRHLPEDLIVTRLEGDVEHLAQRGRLGDGVDDALGHVPADEEEEGSSK